VKWIQAQALVPPHLPSRRRRHRHLLSVAFVVPCLEMTGIGLLGSQKMLNLRNRFQVRDYHDEYCSFLQFRQYTMNHNIRISFRYFVLPKYLQFWSSPHDCKSWLKCEERSAIVLWLAPSVVLSSVSLLAGGSNNISPERDGTEGKKKGAFSGFLGGSTGLFRT
jgi:hypothetical protein